MRRLNKEEAENITRMTEVVLRLAKEDTKTSAVLNQVSWLKDYVTYVFDKSESESEKENKENKEKGEEAEAS